MKKTYNIKQLAGIIQDKVLTDRYVNWIIEEQIKKLLHSKYDVADVKKQVMGKLYEMS